MNHINIIYLRKELDKIKILFKKREFKIVIQKSKALLKKNLNQAIIYNYIGLSYIQLNKIEDALKTLYEAKKVDEFNSDIDYNLSLTYKTIKSFNDAIRFIDSAIKLQPKNPIYKILKADILIESFQNEGAKELLISLKLQKDSSLFYQREILIY